MTVSQKIQAILEAATGVTDLVPVARIRPPGDWQDLTLPYIIHFPVACIPQHTHTGLYSRARWLYQVSCFGSSSSTTQLVAAAVRTALDGNHTIGAWSLRGMFRMEQEFAPEPDTAVHHIPVEFDVFTSLT